MAKSKRKPLSLKRPKRMLPKNREGGVNPLLVGAGAAAGYKAGSAISNRKRQSAARRVVTAGYGANIRERASIMGDDPWSRGLTTQNGPNVSESNREAAAMAAYAEAGKRLPKVSDSKLANRKAAADAMYDQYTKRKGKTPLGRDYEKIGKRASKAAGMTRAEQKIYESRKAISDKAKRFKSSGDLLDAATARQRLASGTAGASRRSRVAGGLSGAAITAIAQLVADELRKKR
jgi:hypothetical protein